MKNIKLLTIVLISFHMISCVFDPPPPSIRVYNSSMDIIEIKVEYNHFILNEFNDNNVFACLSSYTGDYYDNCIKVIDFDTVNLIGKYMLEPQCIFSLRFYSLRDSIFKFNSIKVINREDTINIFASIDSLIMFKKKRWQQYELLIE